MTSLAEQLKKLAVPQGQAIASAHERRRKSILFDPQEAAGLTRDTVYALGVNGIQELATIDPGFEEFEKTIFSQGSQTMERSVQTADVNKVLDKHIRSFLLRLSPYFMLKPAQKAMEWLVYRFGIHQYNIDDIMMCIMPYHTTKLFVRVVQIMNVSSDTHPWNWLKPIQKPGVPLARSTVLTHCYKDPGFLQFVCNMVPLAIKASKASTHQDASRSESALRLTYSFYVSTVIGAIEQAGAIQEEFLAILVPFLTKGLKSSHLDYKVATYMVLSQLCAHAKIDDQLLHPLIRTTCKKSDPSLEGDMISCLAVIYQTQDLNEMQDSVLEILSDSTSLVPTLKKLTSDRDISSLLSVLLQKLVDVLLTEQEDAEGRQVLDKEKMEGLLGKLIFEISLDGKVSRPLVRFLLKKILKTDHLLWTTPFFRSFISNLERQCPEAMDEVIQKQAAKKLTTEKETKLYTFLQMTTSGSKHKVLPEVETSLVLSLNHPNSNTRKLAVNHLFSLSKSGHVEPEFLQSALSLRIEDRDPQVLLALLQFGDELCDLLSADELIVKVEQVLSKWHRRSKGVWPEVAAKCIELLTSERLWNEGDSTDSQKDAAFTIVLPYLLPSSPERTKQDTDMFAQIVNSDLGKSHRIMTGMSKKFLRKKRDNLTKFATELIQHMALEISHYPAKERSELVKFLLDGRSSHHLQEGYGFAVGLILTRAMRMLERDDQLEIAGHLLGMFEVDLGQIAEAVIKGDQDQIRRHDTKDGGIPEPVVSGLCRLLTKKDSTGDRTSAELLLGSLWCVESVAVTLPKVQIPMEEKGWIELGRSHQDCYFLILVKLFDLLTHGIAHATDRNVVDYFKEILALLIQKQFDSTSHFWRFLSMLCTSHFRLHSDKPIHLNYLLQVCCLEMANISFKEATSGLLDEVLQDDSAAFVCLLLNLGHPSKSVRKVAIDCLATVETKSRHIRTPYSQIMKSVLKRGEEIVADQLYLPQALKLTLAKLEKNEKRLSGSESKDADTTMNWLSRCAGSDITPLYVRCALMRTLVLVESKVLLAGLIPSMKVAIDSAVTSEGTEKAYNFTLIKCILNHFGPNTAELLAEKLCRDCFWHCLSQETLSGDGGATIQTIALDRISPDFFSALPSESVQLDLFHHLVDLGVKSQSPDAVKAINRVLRKLPLTSELIVTELRALHPDKKLKNLYDAREARRRKQQKMIDKTDEGDKFSWPKATLVLELLMQKKLHKMENSSKLVPELFNLLSLCLETDGQVDSLEYIKQLVLSLLHTICKSIVTASGSVDGGDVVTAHPAKLTEQHMNVELVVQCVRTSDNPQTHNHALLVLNVAAQLFPEHVLHNVMSIFTFMGASVVKQDDGYSFQVINKTLQTVIPALLKADNEGTLPSSLGTSIHNIVFMIIRIFVDAFPHIPDHRKLPLFTQLVQTVNAEQYVWSCVILLAESFAIKGSSALYPEDVEEGLGRSQQFWMSLCLHFSPQVQIISITKMIQFLSSILSRNALVTSQAASAHSQDDGFDKLLDPRRFSGKQLRQFQFTLVGFFSQLLSCDEFVTKVASLSEDEKSHMQGLYQVLLEENLRFSQQVAQCGENNADNTTAKFWKALLHRTYDVLDKVNALLPSDVFIEVISGLLSNKLPSIRRKAMELLNNILVQHKDRFTENEHALLMGLIDQLVAVARSPSGTAGQEVDVNRQTVLYSLKLLCKILGSEPSPQFTPVLEINLHILQNEQKNAQLTSSALLCLAETVSVLRAYSIPFLTRMVPTILKMVEQVKIVESTNLHLLCAVTAVQKLVETLPNFVSPYIGEILCQVSRLSCNDDNEKTQLNLRLKACRQVLSKEVPLRVLLPAVAQTFAVVEKAHRASIIPLMAILEDHISSSSKEDVLSHHSAMMAFFLDALDFRTNHPEAGLDEALEVEGAVIKSILMHIMKLSENTFRPMYYKFYDWGTSNDAPKSRLLSFYHLSGAIADKLKSIFSLFAGHILSNCAQLLDANNSSKTEESFFEGEQQEANSNLLMRLILSCLQRCFVYDKGAFVSKERFELLSQPVVDQLENLHGDDREYEERIRDHVGPCVSAMMSSVGDHGIWQPLNDQLLLKMRHTSPKVRFAALVVLDQVHQSLKESYLSLLPETIPFLAELMEDESEEVEQKCQELVKDLEKTLGEPLQKHF